MSRIAPVSANETDDELNLCYAGWKVVLAGFFGVMLSFAAVVPYTFGLFLKPLSLEFGWHRESLSAGFSIAALTLAAASPALGFLLDRFGPRRIILPCIVIFASAYASLALLTPHLMHFYLAFFVTGLVGNGTAYLGYSRGISTWFDRRRGLALSVMLAGGGCGAMVLPIVAQAVITHYGWRSAFLVLGVLALIVGFPLSACFVRERPVAQPGAHASVQVGDAVATALSTRIFWIIAATVASMPSASTAPLPTCLHCSPIAASRSTAQPGASL